MSPVHDAAQLPERELRRGITPMREFIGNLPEPLVIGEPAGLQLPVPTADELVRRFREVPEHVRDHARGLGEAQRPTGREVLHEIVVLLDRGNLHDPIMTA
jgi:hypothetical protein